MKNIMITVLFAASCAHAPATLVCRSRSSKSQTTTLPLTTKIETFEVEYPCSLRDVKETLERLGPVR